MMQRLFVFVLVFCGFIAQINADGLDKQLSTGITEQQQKSVVEGGLTATLQHANASGTDSELLSSFDLVSVLQAGQGEVVLYVEGNTSPLLKGVATHFEEANADAGSALDRDGKGRFQVSEFFYAHHIGEHSVIAGLLDPAASLDASEVANDETSQFLGTSFVNNPTIGMPDYTLGIVYHHEGTQLEEGNGYSFTLMAVSSHGLGDNPDASYSELVDISDNGKGSFLAAEAIGQTGILNWHLGIWSNTADHDYLDGSGKTGSNKGAYLSADLDLDSYLKQSRLNIRYGLANDKVSSAATFYALSLEMPLAGNVLGIGLAQTDVSSKVGGNSADLRHAEAYVRFDLSDAFHITPSMQWIENSGLIENKTRKSTVVTSLRASYGF